MQVESLKKSENDVKLIKCNNFKIRFFKKYILKNVHVYDYIKCE